VSAAAAKRAQRPAPIGDEEHRRLGLLPGWKFFRAPADAGLTCWICRQPAAYVSGSQPICARHARDF